MHNRLGFFFTISFFVVSVLSCTCPCVRGELRFGLIGFADSEADTIILRRFEKNENFRNVRDTFFINDTRYSRSGDTLKLTAYSGNLILQVDYDYELFFPGSQALIRISNINEIQTEQSCGIFSMDKVACENEIRSCQINATSTNTTWFNRIYIRK